MRLGRLGDTDDYENRKAKALGVIAERQGNLDLTGETGDAETPRRPVAHEPLRARLAGPGRATRAAANQGSVRSRSSAPPPST